MKYNVSVRMTYGKWFIVHGSSERALALLIFVCPFVCPSLKKNNFYHRLQIIYLKFAHIAYVYRALDKREYLMIIFLISHRNHNVVMMVQMRGHNIGFYAELTKIIHNYHKKTPFYL